MLSIAYRLSHRQNYCSAHLMVARVSRTRALGLIALTVAFSTMPNKAAAADGPASTTKGGDISKGFDAVTLDTTPLTMLDPNLEASVFATGFAQPIGVVFLAQNDMFVLEKASGKVKRVINQVIQATPALDLAVNSNSERGLLSMALDPDFATNHSVYIRWTES